MQDPAHTPSSQELTLLETVIRAVARSRRMSREDAEDFHQTVHLKLVERGYDVFYRFSGKSTLRTYLLVVVHRMLLDWQNHHFGKWRPSAAAVRLGKAAVVLDRLIDRDGHSVDEAIACMHTAGETRPSEELRRLADSLPRRRRRRVIATEVAKERQQVAFEDPIEKAEQVKRAVRTRAVLRQELARLSPDDRRLIAVRYRAQTPVRTIANRINADHKALYRRYDRILGSLRGRLVARGVSRATALERT
jgi:RNA polymerase sigma factor (sigma-70 family)